MNINITLSLIIKEQCVELPLSVPKEYDVKSILSYAGVYKISPEIDLLEPTLNGRIINTSFNKLKNRDNIVLCRRLVCTPQSIRRIKQNRKKAAHSL